MNCYQHVLVYKIICQFSISNWHTSAPSSHLSTEVLISRAHRPRRVQRCSIKLQTKLIYYDHSLKNGFCENMRDIFAKAITLLMALNFFIKFYKDKNPFSYFCDKNMCIIWQALKGTCMLIFLSTTPKLKLHYYFSNIGTFRSGFIFILIDSLTFY